METANSVLDLIGKTPMLKINRLVDQRGAALYAKLEWYNIGGSVKDRMALYLLNSAAAAGKLDKGKTILEATSGNTGIALAMIAAVKGYPVAVVMPESASIERRKIIKAYGAELILSPAEKGTGGAIEVKQRLLRENPNKYVDINQFEDPANIQAHYETTGKEIIEQTGGRVDMVIVGIGTAGTGVGVSMRVKEHSRGIKVIGVTPKIGTGIQGLRNPKEANPTKLFREEYFDEVIELGDEDMPRIFELAKELARNEGLFVGASSAAVMHVALEKASKLGKDKTVVAILPDNGDKYLSTNLFSL
jgi:cysteine synthase